MVILPRIDNLVIDLHERIRPGCTELFDSVTSGFSRKISTRELTLISR